MRKPKYCRVKSDSCSLATFESEAATPWVTIPQISNPDLNDANLERLWLFNCNNLSELNGLDRQSRLREFFASRVLLDLDALRDRQWQASATSVQPFASGKKWNDAAIGTWPFRDQAATAACRGVQFQGSSSPSRLAG